MNKTLIDLLRHGEVQGEACFRGALDTPLSSTGWQQMQQQTQQRPWQAIISSPRRRCRNFAQSLSSQHNIPLVIEDKLREIHFGDWEGKTYAQINHSSPTQLQQFYQNPTRFTPPAGEPFSNFRQRVIQCWQTLLNTYPGQHILIVTHAGVIRLLFSHIFKLPYPQCFQFDIPPACLSRFSHFQAEQNFTRLDFHRPASIEADTKKPNR